MNRAVFLDRDGTLIREKGFICCFDEVEIFPFSVRAVQMMNASGFRVIVITNQSSIGRGICTESQVKAIHRELIAYFARNQATIDGIYYSPYLEDATLPEFRKRDQSRKPAPGMILQAAEDFKIDLDGSFMVGDSSRDIIAGNRAGCKSILVLSGNGPLAREEFEKQGVKPDFIAEDLLGAAKIITRKDSIIS